MSKSAIPPVTRDEALRRYAEVEAPYITDYRASIPDIDHEIARLTNLLLAGQYQSPIMVRLRALGPQAWPAANLDCYRRASRAEDREEFVRSMIFEARDSMVARELGMLALGDRSYHVRIRAHQVLAYGLDRSTLFALNGALRRESRTEVRESARAAINAIKTQNHHKYIDRYPRPGASQWGVNPWDDGDPPVQRGHLNFELARIEEAWQKQI